MKHQQYQLQNIFCVNDDSLTVTFFLDVFFPRKWGSTSIHPCFAEQMPLFLLLFVRAKKKNMSPRKPPPSFRFTFKLIHPTWQGFFFDAKWRLETLPERKTASSPLKRSRNPKGKDRMDSNPSIFRGENVMLVSGSLRIQNLDISWLEWGRTVHSLKLTYNDGWKVDQWTLWLSRWILDPIENGDVIPAIAMWSENQRVVWAYRWPGACHEMR